MTLETLLAELGDTPLKSSRYSRRVKVIINAYLPDDEGIDTADTGQAILARLYHMRNEDHRETVLAKTLDKPIRDHDNYRPMMLIVTVLIGTFVVLGALTTLLNPTGNSGNAGLDFLSHVVDGFFSFLRSLFQL